MPATSNAHSPFRDGFAALWHEPVLLPAELAWRWCFGLSALGLGILSIGLFLDSLTVSRVDELFLRSLQPQLLDNALRHIFRGSLSRFLLEQSVLLLGATLLWALAASVGRAATLRRLFAMFSTEVEEEPQAMQWDFGPIFTCHLLRAMWSMIALAVAFGSLLYGLVMMQDEHPVGAAIALSFGVGLASFIGLTLNWYFAVAPLFCVRNGSDAIQAVEEAVEFSGRHAGRLFLLGLGFLIVRLIWAATMALAFLSPVNLAASIGARSVAVLMAIVVVVYFVGADALRLARLGAYVSLAEDDTRPREELASPEPVPPTDLAPLVGLA
ncbi:MAG: hypothetical protein WA655_21385 [Candidatus Korobacteraceae bacterium]